MSAASTLRRLDPRTLVGRMRGRPSGGTGPDAVCRPGSSRRDGVSCAAPSSSPAAARWPTPGAVAGDGGQTGGLAGASFSTGDLIGLRVRAAGLALEPHRAGRAGRTGTWAVRLRGRGMEYAESRTYMPGDDIRSIDWRVTARTGRVHTKLFEEERDRPILFVVDLGEHMRFGTRRAFKSVVSAEAAALLAWAAVANGDRVGGLAVAGDHAVESRIRGGRRGALAFLRILARVGNATRGRNGSAGIRHALTRARQVARPGTLVVLISDFSRPSEPIGSELARMRRHNDLICVWIHDRLESVPPPPGRYPIGDGRRTATLDTRSPDIARAITGRFESIETRISSACRSAAAILVPVRCGDDVRSVLHEALVGRIRRPGDASP